MRCDEAGASWQVDALLARTVHPVLAADAVARRAGRAAVGIGPVAAGLEVAHLERRIEVVGRVVVGGRRVVSHLRAGGQAHFGADVVQVDQEGLVLPAVRDRNMAPGATNAADLVGVEGVQVALAAVVEAAGLVADAADAVAVRVVGRVVALEAQGIGSERVVLAAGTRGRAPLAFEDEVVGRSVRPPGAAVLATYGHHVGRAGVRAVTIGAIHRLRADVGHSIPGAAPDARRVAGDVADRQAAAGVVQHRMPAAVIVGAVVDAVGLSRRRAGERAGVDAADLALVRERSLELHGLVAELEQSVGARRRAPAAVAEIGRRVVGISGVALQADLVFARDPGAADGGARADAAVAPFQGESRHRAESGPGIGRLDARAALQHAGCDVGVASRMVMRAGGIRRYRTGIEQAVLDHAMGVVAVGAFDVAIGRSGLAEQGLRLDEVLAALRAHARSDVVHLDAGLLVGALDRHAPRQGEIVLDVRHVGDAGQRTLRQAGVALVAGLFDRG